MACHSVSYEKKSYHHRARIFNTPLLKPPAEDRSSNSFRVLSLGRQPGTRAKRIFIIKQAIHLPPTNSAEGRNMQHILILMITPRAFASCLAALPPLTSLSADRPTQAHGPSSVC